MMMVSPRRTTGAVAAALVLIAFRAAAAGGDGEQPLSRIGIHRATFAVQPGAFVDASPLLLGLEGQDREWVTLRYSNPQPSKGDWIGVFSPANFSDSVCPSESQWVEPPLICTAPIKFIYANYKNLDYEKTGKGSLRLQLINQREDFSFALFSGGLSNPKLITHSERVTFVNPKAPVYPRLAQGKSWDIMIVTWTSGYSTSEATPFVKWGIEGQIQNLSPAGTLTFSRNTMCGPPARTVGWRDPGFIHTSFLKDLWPNFMYTYRIGHRLFNGSIVWGHQYSFKAPPYPGEDSLQRVVIFGDMGKAEVDGSNEYNDFEPGSLNTTYQLIKDLKNIDMVIHIGDTNGYLSQWDQFTAQVESIASTVPYMVGSGNHERDWPGSGSFYGNLDSGGECGVPAQNMFYVPAENREQFWYSMDYGMFRFCIANTELDWRPGTEQYKFIERCFSSVDRQKQPWLIFLAHRVLGYSSASFYGDEGTTEEPMGRESLQALWQKYKVDIALYGHVHSYERTCPVYENVCVAKRKLIPAWTCGSRHARDCRIRVEIRAQINSPSQDTPGKSGLPSQGVGPLRRRRHGDDARGGGRRRREPGGLRRGRACAVEPRAGPRLRVREADGLQPHDAAAGVQEEPRRRRARPLRRLPRLPRRPGMRRRQLPDHHTGVLSSPSISRFRGPPRRFLLLPVDPLFIEILGWDSCDR